MGTLSKSFGKIREFYEKNGSGDTVMNCDPVTIMCLAMPGFMQETIPVHGSCITDAGEAYAQVIYYQKGFTYDVAKNDFDYNVELVTKVDKANYYPLFEKAVTGR